jgi:hypothetical protein
MLNAVMVNFIFMFINSVAWQDIEEVYAMEVQVCDDPVNCIHVTAANIIPGQLFSCGA